MLSRFISRASRFQPLLSFVSSQHINTLPKSTAGNPFYGSSINKFYPKTPGSVLYSTKDGDGKLGDADPASDLWKFSTETDESVESVFGEDTGSHEAFHDGGSRDEEEGIDGTLSGAVADAGNGDGNVFDGGAEDISGGSQEWAKAEGHEPWSFGDEAEVKDVFGIELEGEQTDLRMDNDVQQEIQSDEEQEKLKMEEKALTSVLKGSNRAFGDLIESSGITDEMIDSLITLKDFEGIPGLPPLSVIEEKRYQKNAGKSSRAEIERQKQEEVARARVRQVDDKGRAYGTGRRKCSIARVWIEPGEGKFVVNDKEFDLFFPMLDHRATLLRPFSETKTLGMWDVNCTVKGGGTSGQVGAIRLGISRALQNWEPGFRPPLKAAGFLTRDARVVERKKPGKAKARKSFQWVKR